MAQADAHIVRAQNLAFPTQSKKPGTGGLGTGRANNERTGYARLFFPPSL